MKFLIEARASQLTSVSTLLRTVLASSSTVQEQGKKLAYCSPNPIHSWIVQRRVQYSKPSVLWLVSLVFNGAIVILEKCVTQSGDQDQKKDFFALSIILFFYAPFVDNRQKDRKLRQQTKYPQAKRSVYRKAIAPPIVCNGRLINFYCTGRNGKVTNTVLSNRAMPN